MVIDITKGEKMKKPLRILMGILFPFILILTVTSISKALKPEKNDLDNQKEKSNSTEISQKSDNEVKVTLVSNKRK